MKCVNCNKTFQGRTDAKFCSANCRVAYSRANKEALSALEEKPYRVVEGKVYGRRAVIYKDEEQGVVNSQGATWATRPEPDNPTDTPDKDNRGSYFKDGEKYQIDAVGEAHIWK